MALSICYILISLVTIKVLSGRIGIDKSIIKINVGGRRMCFKKATVISKCKGSITKVE
jgi:hypothetical protein